MSLIQSLPQNAMDIIGDVHGEYEALEHLLLQLGYSHAGKHPQDRSLVFTGDLVDRGPDSPGVMEKVIQLVEAGIAYCVLGNHELNILRGVRKGGNEWMLDAGRQKIESPGCRVATPEQARRYRDFLNRQPFALVGPHLRVVHACWDEIGVATLRELDSPEVEIGELYRETETQILAELDKQPLAVVKAQEDKEFSDQVTDPDWQAQMLPAHASVAMAVQMQNPMRVLTTSAERVAESPFWAGGKWRMTERTRWWEQYDQEVPVVIGHFWRLFNEDARRITGMFGADVFEGIAPHAWMGRRRNVYCVDYSVGQRHLERQQEQPDAFHGKLAALRYPEWEVVHDDGVVVAIGPPGLDN